MDLASIWGYAASGEPLLPMPKDRSLRKLNQKLQRPVSGIREEFLARLK